LSTPSSDSSLAFTGAGAGITWAAIAGSVFVLLGVVGRRRYRHRMNSHG
jgi:hypothetical protein